MTPAHDLMTCSLICFLDDEEKLGIPLHANVGEIKVGVERIRAEHETVQCTWDKFKPTGAVHERSKKAGVHCVSYVPRTLIRQILTSTSIR